MVWAHTAQWMHFAGIVFVASSNFRISPHRNGSTELFYIFYIIFLCLYIICMLGFIRFAWHIRRPGIWGGHPQYQYNIIILSSQIRSDRWCIYIGCVCVCVAEEKYRTAIISLYCTYIDRMRISVWANLRIRPVHLHRRGSSSAFVCAIRRNWMLLSRSVWRLVSLRQLLWWCTPVRITKSPSSIFRRWILQFCSCSSLKNIYCTIIWYLYDARCGQPPMCNAYVTCINDWPHSPPFSRMACHLFIIYIYIRSEFANINTSDENCHYYCSRPGRLG